MTSYQDTELTRVTDEAHVWAEKVARFQFGDGDVEVHHAGPTLIVETRLYRAYVRGQTAATAHGHHGTHPEAIRSWREHPKPALVIFVEKSCQTIYWGWLHLLPDPPVNVNRDTASRRVGWACKDLNKSTGEAFRFPTEVPPPPNPDAMRLLEV